MFTIPLDVASGSSIAVSAGLGLGALLVGPVVLEAIILWILQWGGFWRSVLASLLANIVTIIIGFILAYFQLGPTQIVGDEFMGQIIFVVFTLALSVLAEGGVLLLLKPNAGAENWRASLITNIASYAVVILPILFWLQI
jgi:hypothetical protein